jgi:hypothetical protein
MEVHCFKCQIKLDVPAPVSRKEECHICKSDVRCCRNCVFYDSKVYNECRETQAERVLEKERANLCDFFRPAKPGQAMVDEEEKAMSAAEALFKGLKKS